MAKSADVVSTNHGVNCMSIIPMDAEGAIDEGTFRRHLRRMATGGVGVYLCSYGSGEGNQLREKDKLRVFEIGVDELKGKVPVCAAGIGYAETAYTIELANKAGELGVDAVQISQPRFEPSTIKPTAFEIERMWRDILEAVRVPCRLAVHTQQVPGVDTPVDVFERIVAEYDNVIGVSASHPEVAYIVSLIDAIGSKVPVFSTAMDDLLTNLALGIQGNLCAEANLTPRLCASVFNRYQAGDVAGALDAAVKVARVSTVLSGLLPFPRPLRAMKAALNLLDGSGGYLRRPYMQLEEAAIPAIAAGLEQLNIRELEGFAPKRD